MGGELISTNYAAPAVKVWNGQRVVTFKDIDEVHQRPKGTAQRNFKKNRKHFILNEDYFELTRKEFGANFVPNTEKMEGNPNLKVFLFTETGYLMLVKSFRDDLSWNVQRQLVNSYFKMKSNAAETPEQGNRSLLTVDPWLAGLEQTFVFLCKAYGFTRKNLFYHILVDIGKKYNVDDYKVLYKYQKGYDARYIMQVVSYFPELREEAEKTIKVHVERKTGTKQAVL